MHASVTTAKVQPGKVDEAIALWRESVAPEIPGLQGSREAYVLADPKASEVVVIVTYDTEADAEVPVTSGKFQEMVARFEGLLDGEPVRNVYEVGVVVRPAGP